MKKLKVFLLAAVLLVAGSAGAQAIKIGYIRIDDMVGLMPEIPRIDSLVSFYQSDSLGEEYRTLIEVYQFKDSAYRDSVGTKPAVRKQIQEELPGLIYQIQNWQAISQQKVENKQNELLQPIYKKVYDAIRAVAKEKGYTHVLSKEAFLVAPEGDDMLAAVAAKLKVKLPPITPGKVGN
ncbi:MAG: OmpH family outer membrane protein [Bacteroidota bacterium]